MGKNVIYYLNEIMEKVSNIKTRHESLYDSELLVAYRGESQDFKETKLMPSLFRDTTLIKKEKYLFELFSDYGLISHEKRNIDKAIETQHYVAISRMLDITFNSIVGLYFACSNQEKNGYVYIFGFPEYYSPHSNYVEDFYSNILNEEDTISYFKNFKVFSHSYSNERIKAQSGGFIFFPGDGFHPLNEVYYDTVEIEAGDKERLLSEINLLFQISEAKLFPEKDKIANVVKQKFMQKDYCNKQLTIGSEVESCFDRIDYEIRLMTHMKKDELIRILRKEKADLLYYVQSKQGDKSDLNEEKTNIDMQKSNHKIKDKDIEDKIERIFKSFVKLSGGIK